MIGQCRQGSSGLGHGVGGPDKGTAGKPWRDEFKVRQEVAVAVAVQAWHVKTGLAMERRSGFRARQAWIQMPVSTVILQNITKLLSSNSLPHSEPPSR